MNAATLRRLRPSQSGAALIIVLSFVVLLTALVLAYFSFISVQLQISNASASQASARIYANGAVSSIISDLKQEIAGGSTNMSYGSQQVYFPLSPTNMTPARVGTVDGLPNLVKRSAAGLAFYPGGPSRAAALPTTTASLNGRSFSTTRWNAALLLPKANTASSTDISPASTFTSPDWVLTSRDGSNPTVWSSGMQWSASNPATVVGRYAYTVYDEGGLLDMNAAGYPPGSPATLVQDKGGLPYADLTAIPGMTPEAISALIGWRNYASAQPGGTFPAYTFAARSATNYMSVVKANSSGFLQTANNSLVNGQSDRMFLSRQQLIQFMTQAATTSSSDKAQLQNALQYLTTFTRDLEQPSFRPDPKRPKNTTHDWASSTSDGKGYGGNDAYDPTGVKQDLINPAMLTARDTANQPVMKRRFPLSRIALLKQNPSPEEATKIYTYFGLTWDAGNKRWNYDHGTPNQILRLSEIPAGREPDFFETLKASINCESIAKQYGGTGSSTPGATNSPRNYTSGAAALDGVVNYQIIQIGANIIDQYDADSYPTTVAFTPLRIFYGVENLPYLAGWMHSWYRMKKLAAADIAAAKQPPKAQPGNINVYPFETWTMYQPILWNPHAPDAALDTTQVPTNFRVAAGSMTGVPVTVYPITRPAWWGSAVFGRYPAAAGDTPLTWAQSVLSPATSVLTFTATPNTSADVPASFQEPYRLLYKFPIGSNADTPESQCKFSLDALGSIADPVLAANDAPQDGKTILGFFSGKCWTGPWNADSGNGNADILGNCLTSGYSSTNDVQMTLQYQDAGGAWVTYDVLGQVYASSVQPETMASVDNDDSGTQIRAFVSGFRSDPRTDRWGQFTMKTFPLASDPAGIASPPGNQIHTGAAIYRLPHGTSLSPTAGMNTGFVYRLARNASGLPLVDWRTTIYPGDLTVNLTAGSTSGTSAFIPGGKFFYNDPDHVQRRANGGYMNTTTASQNNNGLPMHKANYSSRPAVLNRPFRSVAEMGSAFTDTPWRDINFFAPESGDAALLDAFCLNELNTAPGSMVVAGRVNLNTRQPKVLAAILRGVSKAEGGVLTNDEADRAAAALIAWTTDVTTLSSTGGILTKGPLRNRAELVGKFVTAVTYSNTPTSSNLPNIGYDGSKSYSGFTSVLTGGTGGVFATAPDAVIKRRRECVLRALSDAGNARTWNLMIDVVAQVGRYPVTSSSLSQFLVEGETRFWVHIAIDRYTGQVIAQQWEPVAE